MFINNAYSLIKAGKLYYAEKDMMGEALEDVIFEFPNDSKYLVLYTTTSYMQYGTRILGDATGETKPWYGDKSYFFTTGRVWLLRGEYGIELGLFAFYSNSGTGNNNDSFRIIIV